MSQRSQLVHASRPQAVEGLLAVEIAREFGVNEQFRFATKAASYEKERQFVASWLGELARAIHGGLSRWNP